MEVIWQCANLVSGNVQIERSLALTVEVAMDFTTILCIHHDASSRYLNLHISVMAKIRVGNKFRILVHPCTVVVTNLLNMLFYL